MKFRPKFNDRRFLPGLDIDVDSTVTFEATGAAAQMYEAQPELYTRVDKPRTRKPRKPKKAPPVIPAESRATPVTPAPSRPKADKQVTGPPAGVTPDVAPLRAPATEIQE